MLSGGGSAAMEVVELVRRVGTQPRGRWEELQSPRYPNELE